jgi:hypothetical protein
VVGRQSKRLYLEVVGHADGETLRRVVGDNTAEGAMVYTDEWVSYAGLAGMGYGHATVCHTPGRQEWARDDDGDGVREVHVHTLEGLWTGLRNFLRPFRGVHKRYLGQYVALFWWSYHLKAVTDDLLRILLGVPLSTAYPT